MFWQQQIKSEFFLGNMESFCGLSKSRISGAVHVQNVKLAQRGQETYSGEGGQGEQIMPFNTYLKCSKEVSCSWRLMQGLDGSFVSLELLGLLNVFGDDTVGKGSWEIQEQVPEKMRGSQLPGTGRRNCPIVNTDYVSDVKLRALCRLFKFIFTIVL